MASSSMYSCSIFCNDGEEHLIIDQYDYTPSLYINTALFPNIDSSGLFYKNFKQTKDGVKFHNYRITSFDELLACLYFIWVDDKLNDYIIPIITSVFLYISRRITFNDLIDEIKKKQKKSRSNYSVNTDDFLQLENIDISKNEDEIIDAVKSTIQNIFRNDDLFSKEGQIDLIHLSREKLKLSDIAYLYFEEVYINRTKLLNKHTSAIKQYLNSDKKFPKIKKGDVLYEKEKNKWEDILTNKVFVSKRNWTDSYQEEYVWSPYIDMIPYLSVEDGLLSGKIQDIFQNGPGVIHKSFEFRFEGKKDTLIIPSEKKETENYEYSDYENLRSVVLTAGVEKIGHGTFRGCRDLTSVAIPETVTEIGAFAFDDCENLLDITIPASVKRIGLSYRKDILLYAIENNLLHDVNEWDLYTSFEDCIRKKNIEYFSILSVNNLIPKTFNEFPVIDLLLDAVDADCPEILDILYKAGLQPETGDYDQFFNFAEKHSKENILRWFENAKINDPCVDRTSAVNKKILRPKLRKMIRLIQQKRNFLIIKRWNYLKKQLQKVLLKILNLFLKITLRLSFIQEL